MKRKTTDLQTLTRLALLVAIELVMKAIGLGSVPVGPLYMSFLTLPIAVGAITMGPLAGLILGAVFGAVSFRRLGHDQRPVPGQPGQHLHPLRGDAAADGPVRGPDL